ncbi:Protein disulfide-isomerase LQY1, chloroplastic [Ananas comosus]|uniref:Protein disulfide-isomerase LQY1, chloroplastic n=1 Tax=Ananas comosus TaxID=4615 RepID=A0A199VR15_ANACO|nr:Protein disulfide-isomerase LQY1, chloroplastic [Ananas comosus]
MDSTVRRSPDRAAAWISDSPAPPPRADPLRLGFPIAVVTTLWCGPCGVFAAAISAGSRLLAGAVLTRPIKTVGWAEIIRRAHYSRMRGRANYILVYAQAKRENTQPCFPCNGTGAQTCRLCTGKGSVTVVLGGGETEVSQCINCEGAGSLTCTTCQGTGIQPRYLDRREFKDDD